MRGNWLLLFTISLLISMGSCNDDDVPEAEPEEEVITDVVLTFTPTGGNPVIVEASDPDGEGPLGIEISEMITLASETAYTLTIELENQIAGESITSEVAEEAGEHMFFFSWTSGLFSNPEGNGNIDNRSDVVNYLDADENQFPLGLQTSWITGAVGTGTFRVVLKHQPGVKSATSTVNDGETDIDLEWNLEIE